MRKYFLFLVCLVLSGCFFEKDENKKYVYYDGKMLLKEKCSSCHNLDMPPKTSIDEKAPPIMAVSFHIRDALKATTPSENREKFISFICDYVLEPSESKSLCDEESLKSYGVMPSQKGKVSKEELEAIAKYMYEYYEPKKFLALMMEKERWDKLPLYEKVLKQKNCLSCHEVKKDKIAPSFIRISKKYKNDKNTVLNGIKNGSRKKWKGFRAVMPPFKNLNDKELNAVADWILALSKKEE